MRPRPAQAQFSDPQKEQQLREQHRLVLDAIREGKLDNVLDHAEAENWPPSKNWTCNGSTRSRFMPIAT